MKIAKWLTVSMLSLSAVGAHAQSALTRDQVLQDLKTDVEIRQQLAQHQEVATQSGCDLSAVSYSAFAAGNCSALVQKIASSNGGSAAEKLSSYAAALAAR